MTRVAVLREGSGAAEATFRAIGGHVQASGRTAGEAVDALTARLPEGPDATLIIVRDLRPDHFLPAESRRRLDDLMARWRAARDSGSDLPDADRDELRRLVDAEVEASTARAEQIWHELGR
jgi:hypothetical protein